ncbi:CDP-alcohol phosphatidyltransferase family protein [Bradyrhizobium iriomotense]|uniref:CDP-alcohol phosphatidyltransferase n=1 Tax=Bradyrhizobium iriomotense TaxID=441950 RepID=A0ABQ6B794_9BRAD|nr:CDP-alcohol phosphatidyltransferase family protein [Bradyrhizobium iriomotense]GLR90282.1 hypothetical protein GCM10007857_69960 [Bradyrhizobium iriomotense]
MVGYLLDPANAITAVGLVLASVAINFALAGRMECSIALGLWAMLADQLDGVVASRTKNRQKNYAKMGKSLDGFADIVYGAILPALLVILLSDGAVYSRAVAVLMILAGALRLSYFNNFGLSEDGYFTGLPLSYDIPLLSLLFIVDRWCFPFLTPTNVASIFLLVSVLHISPLLIPSPGKAIYSAIVAYSLVATGFLLAPLTGVW